MSHRRGSIGQVNRTQQIGLYGTVLRPSHVVHSGLANDDVIKLILNAKVNATDRFKD